MELAQEALGLYLATLAKDGLEIPFLAHLIRKVT